MALRGEFLFFAPESSGPLPEEARKPDQTPPVVITPDWAASIKASTVAFGKSKFKSAVWSTWFKYLRSLVSM